jgi:very-short-patch-repair endonuclease
VHGNWRGYDPASLARIRAAAKTALEGRESAGCERALYALLDELAAEGHLKAWERQYPISFWTVDAAIPEQRLVVQADGEYWHGHLPGSRDDPRVRANVGNDARCDQALAGLGWTVLRLRETQLLRNPAHCREAIVQALGVAGEVRTPVASPR